MSVELNNTGFGKIEKENIKCPESISSQVDKMDISVFVKKFIIIFNDQLIADISCTSDENCVIIVETATNNNNFDPRCKLIKFHNKYDCHKLIDSLRKNHPDVELIIINPIDMEIIRDFKKLGVDIKHRDTNINREFPINNNNKKRQRDEDLLTDNKKKRKPEEIIINANRNTKNDEKFKKIYSLYLGPTADFVREFYPPDDDDPEKEKSYRRFSNWINGHSSVSYNSINAIVKFAKKNNIQINS